MNLVPHPATPCPAVTSLTAVATRAADLRLVYELRGDLSAIALPPIATPGPADRLWEHTCFETFLGRERDAAYVEYNFAPSGQWAAYAFADYRRRSGAAAPAPSLDWRHAGDRLTLDARVPLAPRDADAVLRLGLSAVIETRAGGLSYWALAHPGPRPDFHHRDARTLRLPPPA